MQQQEWVTTEVPVVIVERFNGLGSVARARDLGLIFIPVGLARSFDPDFSKDGCCLGDWFLVNVRGVDSYLGADRKVGWTASKICSQLPSILPYYVGESSADRSIVTLEEVPVILTGFNRKRGSTFYSEYLGCVFMRKSYIYYVNNETLLGKFSVTMQSLLDDSMDRSWVVLRVEPWNKDKPFPKMSSLKKFKVLKKPKVDELNSDLFFSFNDCAHSEWDLLKNATGVEGLAAPTFYKRGPYPYRAVYVRPLTGKAQAVSSVKDVISHECLENFGGTDREDSTSVSMRSNGRKMHPNEAFLRRLVQSNTRMNEKQEMFERKVLEESPQRTRDRDGLENNDSMLHSAKDSLTQGKKEKRVSENYRTFYGQDKEMSMSEFLGGFSEPKNDAINPMKLTEFDKKEKGFGPVETKDAESMTENTLEFSLKRVETMIYEDTELLEFFKENVLILSDILEICVFGDKLS